MNPGTKFTAKVYRFETEQERERERERGARTQLLLLLPFYFFFFFFVQSPRFFRSMSKRRRLALGASDLA